MSQTQACPPTSRAAVSTAFALTSSNATLAPAAASAPAVARPIPDAAPVTSAPIPVNCIAASPFVQSSWQTDAWRLDTHDFDAAFVRDQCLVGPRSFADEQRASIGTAEHR